MKHASRQESDTTSRDSSSTLRNVALVSAASYVESAVGLFVGVIIARSLGPHYFGEYAYAVWLCGWLMLASNHALTTSAIKFLAEARGAGNFALAAALGSRLRWLQIASSGVVLGIFAIAAVAFPPDEWREALVFYLPVAIMAVWARAGFWSLGSIAKGYERFEPENVALALTALVNLGLVLAIWAIDGTAELYFAAYAVTGLVANLIVRRWLRRCRIEIHAGPIPDAFLQRFNSHVFLTAVITILGILGHRAIEVAFLKAFSTPVAVGYFAIATTLTRGAVDLLSSGLSAVVLPAMARAFGRGGRKALADLFAESARVYWLVGLAVAGGGLVVAGGVMRLLYGHRYEGAIPAVAWSLVVAGMLVTGAATTGVLVVGDRQADRIKVNIAAMAVNAIAGIALIPTFGLVGALVSLTVTQCFGFWLSFMYARRHFSVSFPLGTMARALAAAGLATAAGMLVSSVVHNRFAFVMAGVVFVALYAALLVVFRALFRGDYASVARLLEGRGELAKRLGSTIDGLGRRFAGVA